ncbi:acyl-CoA dehydrogenase family protein [Micrococcus terreus]|uniref:acyl-CoA dehydrogenase family protein n=1 Tax=Micrococcus terreus TaxID=574650 RepID=UPI00254B53ED|nr:acyl-CoA dehydrogenase family protein [Micrococcus terreus]MDK7702005.1 acyl-CoA dehydrogenase family protein [Micrococcus terreus]WOO97308.1 acyl-CoA dehydrogenase family protein [Micrococcus terreus]
MTTLPSRYTTLSDRFAPAFAEVAQGELPRETGRHLPFAAFEQLREQGLGALSVPESAGGAGASQEDAFRLLMDLAAVDANTAHLVRSHLSFVQHLLAQPDRTVRDRWLQRVVEGDVAGSALSEGRGAPLGEFGTTVTQDEAGQLLISGSKYYTTGSIFSTWALATVRLDPSVSRALRGKVLPRGTGSQPATSQGTTPATGSGGRGGSQRADVALAVVRVRQPRITVKDDWDGFGQRLTGTGTMEFHGAGVEELLALPPADGPVPLHHESTLMALLAGIGRAALRDGVEQTRRRRRSPNTGGGLSPREDDQLLGIIGELSAQQATVEELVRAAGRDLDAALTLAGVGQEQPDGELEGAPGGRVAGVGMDGDDAAAEAMHRAALTAHRAHVMVPKLVLDTCTRIFDTLGASATSTDLQLDRHWRNARTIASHDPAVFMARMVGDWEVNGTRTVPYLQTGTTDEA